jgi:hypothetical protein
MVSRASSGRLLASRMQQKYALTVLALLPQQCNDCILSKELTEWQLS